jgi:hypothetical protein
VSVIQQSVLSPEVSGLELHACASNARICSTADIAVPRGLWPTAPRLCCTFTVCLQEPAHLLGVSIYMGFCAAPGVSVYKRFVLHLDVSAYKSFVLHLDLSVYKNLFLYLCVSVYKSFVTHLDVSAYQSTDNTETVGFRL